MYVDASFFSRLAAHKLDSGLSTEGVPIGGELSLEGGREGLLPSVALNDVSFDCQGQVRGEVVNVNSLEEFKRVNKRALLATWAKQALEASSVADIGYVGVLMYADLKRYKFYYWCCQPQCHPEYDVVDVGEVELSPQPQYTGSQYAKHGDGVLMWGGTCDDVSGQIDVLRKRLGNLVFFMGKKFKLVVVGWENKGRGKVYEVTPREGNIKLDSVPLTGWERTPGGKLGPRAIDLSTLLDPLLLSAQARDLNLKLMRWRLAPDLPLEKIKATKCLLLGAGTLGTYVGRLLVAWGVDKVTFVDSGRVSFSNPPRQPLFEYTDCLEGGKRKAEAAAEGLKRVYPGVDAQGVVLEVPMVGHPVVGSTQEAYEELRALIEAHDVVYLLMDSREARWLPTALARGMGKTVVNAALGFDSYVVMRHGVANDGIGCYYCSSVSAPGDSMIDRTLDQMCTVTRPGLAPVAAGVAVELMVDVVASGGGAHSEALPQQVRGYLNGYRQGRYECVRFSNCVGCCDAIVEAVAQWDTLEPLLRNPSEVERVSGIVELVGECDVDFEEDGGLE